MVLLVGGNDFYTIQQFRVGGHPPSISTDSLDMPRALLLIDEAGVDFAQEWKQKLLEGRMDAFVTLLLAQFRGITHLVLGRNFAKQNRLLGLLFRSVVCTRRSSCKNGSALPTFENLRQVHCAPLTDPTAMRADKTADILPFFYLPQIKAISAGLDNPAQLSWPCDAPMVSTITSLDLVHVREAALFSILSVVPKLKTLRWEWYYDRNFRHETHTPLIDLDEITKALEPVRDTLEHLTVTAHCALADINNPWLDLKGSMVKLRDFAKLKSIRVPFAFLATFTPQRGVQLAEVIPVDIETVVLTDDLYPQAAFERDANGGILGEVDQYEWTPEEIITAIKSWLCSWKATHSRLRSVTMLLEEDPWEEDVAQIFRGLSEKYGIEVGLVEKEEEWPQSVVLSDLVGFDEDRLSWTRADF
ncbi:hypothetical protein ANO11243_049720 [Dothideomycetidae sp. 11243]|nr:hypothetical protein ANO11243_049720 [fungal sp. No.11243]